MTIGENIKKARKEAGLTQKELGEKLGITQQAIAMFENDKTNIKFSTIKKIAAALGVYLNELLDDNWNLYTDEIKEVWKDNTADRAKLNDYYDLLNKCGKEEAVKRVEELTYIDKYTKPD